MKKFQCHNLKQGSPLRVVTCSYFILILWWLWSVRYLLRYYLYYTYLLSYKFMYVPIFRSVKGNWQRRKKDHFSFVPTNFCILFCGFWSLLVGTLSPILFCRMERKVGRYRYILNRFLYVLHRRHVALLFINVCILWILLSTQENKSKVQRSNWRWALQITRIKEC
jgi:hypothetical protein